MTAIASRLTPTLGLWLSAEYVNATKPCGSWCFQDGSVGALVIARLAADMYATIIADFACSMHATIITDFARAVDPVVITDFTSAVDAMVISRFSMGAVATG